MNLIRNFVLATALFGAGFAHANSALIRDYRAALSDEQSALAAYVMRNPLPSVALMALGGGLAATLQETMSTDQLHALQLAGAAGVVYCLMYEDKCADAFANITVRLTRISTLETRLRELGANP
jgi:hypothetical protein